MSKSKIQKLDHLTDVCDAIGKKREKLVAELDRAELAEKQGVRKRMNQLNRENVHSVLHAIDLGAIDVYEEAHVDASTRVLHPNPIVKKLHVPGRKGTGEWKHSLTSIEKDVEIVLKWVSQEAEDWARDKYQNRGYLYVTFAPRPKRRSEYMEMTGIIIVNDDGMEGVEHVLADAKARFAA